MPDAATAPDAEPPSPDAGVPDSGAAPDGGSPCLANNRGEDCTDTERLFVEKSVDCYNCLIAGECLDDAINGNTRKECGDLEGNASNGAQKGAPKSELCLSTIECILGSHCASGDISICYCGSLGAGVKCTQGASGANGPCLQAEVDGVERMKTDPQSEVFRALGDVSNASGRANQIFICAKQNNCELVLFSLGAPSGMARKQNTCDTLCTQ